MSRDGRGALFSPVHRAWDVSAGGFIPRPDSGQRVAMRVNGTLSYILGDHLGSTSITTNNAGTRTSETLYKPWGEVRYSWGTTPTDYTYTGQYSNVDDFGLMYYGARWCDPALDSLHRPEL